MADAHDLLQTTFSTTLNVIATAVLIEQQFGEFLVPAAEGIYKVGDAEPSIIPGRIYYSEKVLSNKSRVTLPITNFEACKDHVVDDKGNLVIAAYMMQNKARYLTQQPAPPTRGVLLVEQLLRNFIESQCRHTRRNHYVHKIENQIMPEHSYIYHEGHLEACCRSLLDQVSSFMNGDDWHIYFVKRVNLDIRLEKTIDFRIYEWTMANDPAYRQ